MTLPPPPTTADDPATARIPALLDKAESTPFAEEAEAFYAKAQELMTRHRISDAMVERNRSTSRGADEIEVRTVRIQPPYASAKTVLLGAVATANDCRAVWRNQGEGVADATLVGHRSDLDATEALYLSLSLHAVRAMLDATVPPGDTARRFRRAFLLAFAGRIGERLREATVAAQREYEAETGTSTAVVLAKRSEAVDVAFRREFPNVRTTRLTVSSGAGVRSGRAAADRARLGLRVLPGGRRSLGRGRN